MVDDGRLRCIDLFSGIGGISLALAPYTRTVAYCDIDPESRKVLASRMADGRLETAPVFEDVRSMDAVSMASSGIDPSSVNIVTAGFPCQDLSIAGRQMGAQGNTRSSLWTEALRIADLCGSDGSEFIFLENVPNILNLQEKGLGAILPELHKRGYYARWLLLSCGELGACHTRDRWWCICWKSPNPEGLRSTLAPGIHQPLPVGVSEVLRRVDPKGTMACTSWAPELPAFRVHHGPGTRLDQNNRVRCGLVGNAVSPPVARIAFETLIGFQYVANKGNKQKKKLRQLPLIDTDELQDALPFGWYVERQDNDKVLFYAPSGKTFRSLKSALKAAGM